MTEKIVYSWENMPDSWDEVPVGSEITKEVYDDMLDCMPPIRLRKSPYCGFQVGEAVTHEEDSEGRWRAKYSTFVNIGNKFYYAGVCFGGECDWRFEG